MKEAIERKYIYIRKKKIHCINMKSINLRIDKLDWKPFIFVFIKDFPYETEKQKHHLNDISVHKSTGC